SGKTFATIRTHEGYPERWILPRWSLYRLKDVKAVIVEEWLRSLPLANGSKAKIRNLMHSIFNHAMRWEWHDRNPITRVRQSRQTSKDSGRVGYRADQVSARTSKGAWQDSRASRHSHRAAGERTARAEMVGRGLWKSGAPRHPFHLVAACRSMQDRSVAEAGSARSRTC